MIRIVGVVFCQGKDGKYCPEDGFSRLLEVQIDGNQVKRGMLQSETSIHEMRDRRSAQNISSMRSTRELLNIYPEH